MNQRANKKRGMEAFFKGPFQRFIPAGKCVPGLPRSYLFSIVESGVD